MGTEFVPEGCDFQTAEAVNIESCTLLGFNNCFSVRLADGSYADVVNFYHEDIEDLLEKKEITWPIQVAVLGPKTVAFNDPRLPHGKYRKDFCTVCCPVELLPTPQRLQIAREIQCGKTKYTRHEGGMVIISHNHRCEGAPKLTNWKVEINPNPTVVYCLDEAALKAFDGDKK
jgi:hypothetical protein